MGLSKFYYGDDQTVFCSHFIWSLLNFGRFLLTAAETYFCYGSQLNKVVIFCKSSYVQKWNFFLKTSGMHIVSSCHVSRCWNCQVFSEPVKLPLKIWASLSIKLKKRKHFLSFNIGISLGILKWINSVIMTNCGWSSSSPPTATTEADDISRGDAPLIAAAMTTRSKTLTVKLYKYQAQKGLSPFSVFFSNNNKSESYTLRILQS